MCTGHSAIKHYNESLLSLQTANCLSLTFQWNQRRSHKVTATQTLLLQFQTNNPHAGQFYSKFETPAVQKLRDQCGVVEEHFRNVAQFLPD